MIDYERLAQAACNAWINGTNRHGLAYARVSDQIARAVVAALAEQGLVVIPKEIVDAVDAWVDQIGYDAPERERLFLAVRRHRATKEDGEVRSA